MMKVLFVLIVLVVYIPWASTSLSGEQAQRDTVEEKRSCWLYLPILFYTPETKLAGGAGISYCFREPRSRMTSRPSTITSNFIYTQRRQIIGNFLTNIYLRDEAYNVKFDITYRKFPTKFYGIGNRSSEDDEEDYTPESLTLLLGFQKSVGKGLNLGLEYELVEVEILEVEEGGFLDRNGLLGSQGGTASGAGFLLSRDTRDNMYSPATGGFYRASAAFFSNRLGGEYDFTRYILDLRRYVPIISSHVLAFQGIMRITAGDPPFHLLSSLGGSQLMRGYYEGRYRDRHSMVFQAEHRFPVWWRFGMVLFAGIGDVAEKIDTFERRNFKTSVGWGVRYQAVPTERLNMRLDFGYGKGTSGFYVSFAEAF